MVAVLVQNFVADKAIVSSNQEVRTAQWVGNTSITRLLSGDCRYWFSMNL